MHGAFGLGTHAVCFGMPSDFEQRSGNGDPGSLPNQRYRNDLLIAVRQTEIQQQTLEETRPNLNGGSTLSSSFAIARALTPSRQSCFAISFPDGRKKAKKGAG